MTKRKAAITWSNEKRKLSDLIPWERNPRVIKDAQAGRLVESFQEFGQVLPICIGPNGDIYDGHQRRNVISAATQYGMDYEVDVRVTSRELTEKEREKLTVLLHKGATGEFDFGRLTDWDFAELAEWGFDDIGTIAETAKLAEIGDAPKNNERNLGDKRKQIKPVLYADEIADFERAIRATGERDRGGAILEICRFYLDHHAERQFNFTFEGAA